MDAKLKGRESKQVRGQRATSIVRVGENIAVRYHDTKVITFTRDGCILNSGGFRTYTTKARINEHLPAPWVLFSSKGEWYLTDRSPYRRNPEREDHLFKDGIELRNGRVLNAGGPLTAKFRRGLVADIDAFSEEFCLALLQGRLAAPGPEDCQYCRTRGANADPTSIEDEKNHLRGHLESREFVPALLLNALGEAGWTREKYLYSIVWNLLTGSGIYERDAEYVMRDATCALSNYIRRRFGFPHRRRNFRKSRKSFAQFTGTLREAPYDYAGANDLSGGF